jgi:hypothetical protein
VQLGARRAAGVALVGVGLVVGGIAAFIGIVGLESALTVWNDQMGLLPWGLSRILGITVYLDIPADAPWYAAGLRRRTARAWGAARAAAARVRLRRGLSCR